MTTILHPLVAEGPSEHRIESITQHSGPRVRRVRLYSRPPYTFPLDLLVPLRPPPADLVFAFNNLVAAKALARRAGRPRPQVVYWAVDFVPDRFGPGTWMTKVYDHLDRHCCLRADLRVELSEAARQGRDDRHRLPESAAPVEIAPMGAWLRDLPVSTPASLLQPTAVYLGHLVPRQGVLTFIEAVGELRRRGIEVTGEIVGSGPQERELKARVRALGLDDMVVFHGFVEDRGQVERLLAKAAVGVAPYRQDPRSFTRFADPGKLKAYLAAGLPIVVTDVPPNASELAACAGAEVVDDTPSALAEGIFSALVSEHTWRARHEAALRYSSQFDWPLIFDRVLARLGNA